ncbi:MAG: ATP-binding protein [Sphaerobacter sp.]|nr:ATP-binding protein [Sphaerobacter sp.]
MSTRSDSGALLDHLSRLLVRASDLDAVVDAALDLVLERGAHNAAVFLYHPERRELVLAGQRNHPRELLDQWRRLSLDEETLITRAVRTGVCQSLADGAAEAGFLKTAESASRTGFRAAVACPLLIDERPVGAFACGYTEPLGPADEREATLRTIAHVIAVAVQHARLASEAQQRAADQALLVEATRRFNSTLDLTTTLNDVARIVAEAVGDSCAIFQIDPARPAQLSLAALYHCDPAVAAAHQRHVTEQPLCTDKPPVADIVATGQARLLDAATLDETTRRAYLEPLGIVAGVMAPIIYHGALLGVLGVFSTTPGVAYGERELRLAGRLADSAAPAIANAQLFQRLSDEHVFLQSVLDHLPEAVMIAEGPDRRLTIVNRAVERLLGPPPPPGLPLREWVPQCPCRDPEGRLFDPDRHPMVRAAAGETLLGQEILVARPDGTELTVLGNFAPVRDQTGRVVGSVAVMQDISWRRELEQEKDDFLAVAAHELRSPLTTIHGHLQLIMRRPDRVPEDLRGRLQVVQEQVERMTQMAARLLDVSRIGMDRLDLRLAPVDLGALVAGVARRFEPRMADHRLMLLLPERPVIGRWDAARLEEVLANLLENAVRYSPRGSQITVSVGEAPGIARLEVRDQGVGIPPDALPHLFTRYGRVRRGSSGGGLGLGLYICRGIVEAHGGRIGVESQPGAGSTFWIELPRDA